MIWSKLVASKPFAIISNKLLIFFQYVSGKSFLSLSRNAIVLLFSLVYIFNYLLFIGLVTFSLRKSIEN